MKPAFLLSLSLAMALPACHPPITKKGDDSQLPADDTDAVDDTGEPVDPDDTAPPDQPPVAVVAMPGTARIGQGVTLDGSGSSDPQGYALSAWDWSCDDGTTAAGETAEVTFAAAGELTCTLQVTSASGLTGSDSGQTLVLDGSAAAWTFMVFVNGDNNLEDSALGDVNEMEMVGSSAEVNIVVQLDRARGESSADGNWTGARRYLIARDSDTDAVTSTVLEDLGATDSGVPETISDFATWGIESFPAERYALVLWDHGWGWYLAADGETKGISEDASSGNDISIARGDLEEALAGVAATLGRPLDLLGMDACLMSSWEVHYVSAPYADVFVGSQASEDWDGWPYDTAMADLVADPGMDAAALGEVIARRFYETRDSTQSVVDLAALGDLNAALDALAQAMIDTGRASDLLDDGASDAQDFEHGWGQDHDIGDFLDHLEGSSLADADVLAAIEGVREVYARVVLANYTNGRSYEDATGISIYTPTWGRMDSEYTRGTWADETLWDDFIDQARGGY
ncbi:MAG: clostripain-related cysteine peptidase [Pseudomonadota bacterium]